MVGAELIHRQPLVLRFENSSPLDRYTHGELAGTQPVDGLAQVRYQRHIHLAEQAAQILRSEIGMIIEKLPRNPRSAHFANVRGDNLSLELGIQQIPIGFVFARIDQLSVVCRAGAGRYIALVDENILSLFVGVLLFALPPSGGVGDFRQDQSRLYRIEHFALIKNLKKRISTTVVNVDKIFAGSPLRRNTLGKVGSGAGNVSYFDLGVSFLKYPRIDNS